MRWMLVIIVYRRWLALCLFVVGLFLVLASAHLAGASPPRQSPDEGEALFRQYCAGCHTIGGGDLSGPDLQGVAGRRDPDWLEHWLAEPDVMIAEGDPIARELLAQYNNIPMPNQHLTLSEIDSLLAYLGVAQPAHVLEQAAQAALAGDPGRGKALYTGAQAFGTGGTACIACHDTAAVGVPGGGLLGPDLTQVIQRYGGEAGLRGALGTIAFPSMVPIYQNRPLSPQEQADLAAFFAQSTEQAAPRQSVRHVALFLLAFGALDVLLVGLFVWQGRLPQHRRHPLIRRFVSSRTE